MGFMCPIRLTNPNFEGIVEMGEHDNGNPLDMSEIYLFRLPFPFAQYGNTRTLNRLRFLL